MVAKAIMLHAGARQRRLPVIKQREVLLEVKAQLEEQAPKGAPGDPFEQKREDY